MYQKPQTPPLSVVEIEAVADRLIRECQTSGELETALEFTRAVLNDPKLLDDLLRYKRKPVGVREFIESPDYMDSAGILWPALMDGIEECNSGKYQEAVLTGPIGCVDADTEFLSPMGWRRVADYAGEQVAQYDLETGKASFVHPGFVKYPCSEFHHFRTKYGVDQALSSEHRMLFRNDKTGKFEVWTAGDVAEKHEALKQGFEHSILTTFDCDGGPGVPLTEAQIRVQVMVAADGSFAAPNRTCVVAVKKDVKVARARALLIAAGIEWGESPRPGGGTRFRFRAPLREKSLAFMWPATRAQALVALDEARKWDARLKTGRAIYSTDKPTIDFLQYAACLAGLRSSILRDERPERRTCYTLQLSLKTEITMAGVPKTEMGVIPSSDGFKYCFEVSTSFWVMRRNGRVAITGNTGKTSFALYSMAYQVYLLSCFRDPHRELLQDPSAEIVFIVQSRTKSLAKDVDYTRLRTMFSRSPYFRKHFPYDEDLSSEMRFPNRVIIRPVAGTEEAAIGSNVLGAIIDEMNFMKFVEESKLSRDGTTYDQARKLYNSIASRRKSRFMRQGRMPGMLYLVSSRNYPGEFTDQKEAEARENPLIFVWDARLWDLDPERFCGDNFSVFIGDESRRPKVLTRGEAEEMRAGDDAALVMDIPIEYENDFRLDITNQLREVAGVATIAKAPFISAREKVSAAFQPLRKSILSLMTCDLVKTNPAFVREALQHREQPRWVHVDLALTGDSCGMACGYVERFTRVDRAGSEDAETLPVVTLDFALQIAPPRGGEIEFARVRDIIVKLQQRGVPIRWVSFDTWQSADSIQLLRAAGFSTGALSIDKTPMPYIVTKTAILDGRLNCPDHWTGRREFLALEWNVPKQKIDHPPAGSKDVSDAIAGVVYGLTTRRSIWINHGVGGRIPIHLRQVPGKRGVSDGDQGDVSERDEPAGLHGGGSGRPRRRPGIAKRADVGD